MKRPAACRARNDSHPRKPGAFANYRWRQELFPAPVFRTAYDHLTRTTHEAGRRYLEVLQVAAEEGLTPVENSLEALLSGPHPVVSAVEVRALLATWKEQHREWRTRPPLEVSLADYDALLGGEDDTQDEQP